MKVLQEWLDYYERIWVATGEHAEYYIASNAIIRLALSLNMITPDEYLRMLSKIQEEVMK